jgi:hypothetical protein
MAAIEIGSFDAAAVVVVASVVSAAPVVVVSSSLSLEHAADTSARLASKASHTIHVLVRVTISSSALPLERILSIDRVVCRLVSLLQLTGRNTSLR